MQPRCRALRLLWQRQMRAEHGNGMASDPSDAQFTTLSWNARALSAAIDSEDAASKANLLCGVLCSHRPTVAAIFEVITCGSSLAARLKSFRPMRKRLRALAYEAIVLPGEGSGGRNAIVVAVDKRQARLLEFRRVDSRALGLRVAHKRETTERALVAMHGPTSSAGEIGAIRKFKRALGSAESWLKALGGGVLFGDLNYVPCAEWRASREPLNTADRALRTLARWGCTCCHREGDLPPSDSHAIAGGDGGIREGRGWTRYATHDRVLGAATSRIDMAVAVGGAARWEEADLILPVDSTSHGSEFAVSDHVVAIYTTPLIGPRTSRPQRPRAPHLSQDDPLTAATAECLEECADIFAERIADAKLKGRPTVDACIATVGAAGAHASWRLKQIAASAAGSGAGTLRAPQKASPKRLFFMWRHRLNAVRAHREHGVSAAAAMRARAEIFHPATGLRSFICASGDGWQRIVRRCRHEMQYAARLADSERMRDTQRDMDHAARILEIPEDNVQARRDAAFRATAKERGSCNLEFVKLRSAGGRRIHCGHTDAPALLAQEGQSTIDAIDEGAVVPAIQAFTDKFVGQWPEIKGSDGGTWSLRKEFTFDVFTSLVRGLPAKAVGASGVALAQLKLAPESVLLSVYNAMVSDITSDTISDRWHRVLYVLLAKKPPNDPEKIGERREIALTEHDVKLLLHAIRRTCYVRALGRVAKQCVGWVPGFGCTDQGMASAWAVDQARRLGHPLYLLFADLSTFFSRIQREGASIADLAVGLPAEVIAIATAIYGAGSDDPRVTRCQYDTCGGLSDTFANGVGALMGCPLSTDRARIFLNSVIIAIQVHTKGLRLWGSPGDDGGWRRVAQLVCADDWLGVYESAAELEKAWAIWSLWEPMTGAKIGIKAADKTVLTGVAYDERGRPRTPADPRLKTADGRLVPMRDYKYAYSHLGRARCAGASRAAAFKKFKGSFMAAVTRIRRLRRPTRHQVMVVSEALIGGNASFYLQDLFLTWKEADGLEAKWRCAYNKALGRSTDTPRAELYSSAHVAGTNRRHLYSHGLTALYTAVNESIADGDDCEHRALARSGLALTFYQWGCRQDPRTWHWGHLRAELTKSLHNCESRLLGEAYMLATLELLDAPTDAAGDINTSVVEREHWRWVTPPPPSDPLSASATHFLPTATPLVSSVAPEASDRFLLALGYVATGHLTSRVRGAYAWATFDEACVRDKRLRTVPNGRSRWDAVTAALTQRGVLPVARERPCSAAALFRRDCDVRVAGAASQVTRLNAPGVRSLAAEMLAARQQGVRPYAAADVAHWRAALDECMGEPPPQHVEWKHGVPDGLAAGEAARVVYDIYGDGAPHEEGGAAGWLDRASTGGDGYAIGWQASVDIMRARFGIDEEGFVTDGDDRVPPQALRTLPPCLELVARARHALGAVPVTDAPVCKEAKSSKTHVNLTAAWGSLNWAIETQCRFLITHAATVDGSKVVKAGVNGAEYAVVARAAALNDGTVVEGRLIDCEDTFLGEDNTTYFAEKIASNEALGAIPAGARVAIWLDSTSPVHALRRFRRVPARRKAKLHGAAAHAATECMLRRHEVVIYHWQMSHTGDPSNEWADVLAGAAAKHERPLETQVSAPCSFVTALAPRLEQGPREWAARRGDALVHDRLRSAARNTVILRDSDIKPIGVRKSFEHGLAATRAERRLPTDAGHRGLSSSAKARRLFALRCPHCDAVCDWLHICFECDEPTLVDKRHRWGDTLEHLRTQSESQGYHADLRCALQWICRGVPALHHAAPVYGSAGTHAGNTLRDDRRSLRRVAGAAVQGCPSNRNTHDVRRAAGAAANAGEDLLATGARSCLYAWQEGLRHLHLTEKVFGSYARKLRARILSGGPLRAAVLRCLHDGSTLLPRNAPVVVIPALQAWAWLARLTWWRLRARCRALQTAIVGQASLRPWQAHPELLRLAHAALLAGWRGSRYRRSRSKAAKRPAPRPASPDGGDVRALIRRAPAGTGAAPRVVDCGAARARRGSKRHVAQIHNRAVREGRSADHRRGGGAWEAECIVDVRRRAVKGFALDARIRWVGQWDDTWEPVNKHGIPSDELRTEARAMWQRRAHEGGREMDSDEEEDYLRHADGWSCAGDSDCGDEGHSGTPGTPDDAPEALGTFDGSSVGCSHAQSERLYNAELDGSMEGIAWSDDPCDAELLEALAVQQQRLWQPQGGNAAPLAPESNDGGAAVGAMRRGGTSGCNDVTMREASAGASSERNGRATPTNTPRSSSSDDDADAARDRVAREAYDGASDSDDGMLVCDGPELARLAAAAAVARPRRLRGGWVDGLSGAPRQCHTCGAPLPVERQLCAACVSRALGWTGLPAHSLRAVDVLCNEPSLAALEGLLTDVDVSDNGSCWVYAALVTHGLAAHALRLGLPVCSDGVALAELRPTQSDRRLDAILREAVATWVADNGGVGRFDGVRSSASLEAAEARLTRIRCRIPTRAGASGEWGGDTEMLAVASLLECNIFTYRASRGDVAGSLFSPIRGTWTRETVGTALRAASADGIPLIVLSSHNGVHWHARVPCQHDGRVLVKELAASLHGFGLDAARTAVVGARLRAAGWA